VVEGVMKVKLCGVTSLEDAMLALNQGADALGFNFFPRSPRFIEPDGAAAIVRQLPPFAVCVGVFVNEPDPGAVSAAARCAGVTVIQLHGDESPEYCRALSAWPLIKALRIETSVPPALTDYPVRAFLLDSKDDTSFGGTGKVFDWELAAAVKLIRPILLAGGLNARNVAQAIRKVRPYGIDVCSGVESAPGKKDPEKVASFMNEVRNACR
jgi:phosphoribosylanthranilate isomerase